MEKIKNNPVGRYFLIDGRPRRIVSAEPTDHPADGLPYWNAKTHDKLDLSYWYPENEILPAWIAAERNPYGTDWHPVVFIATRGAHPYLTAATDAGNDPATVDYARRLKDTSVFTDWLEPIQSRYKNPPLYFMNKREFFDLIKGA